MTASAAAGLAWNNLSSCQAQQSWQPTRPSSDPWQQTASPALGNDQRTSTALRPVLSSTERVGAGVVLRWQSTAPREGQSVGSTGLRSQHIANHLQAGYAGSRFIPNFSDNRAATASGSVDSAAVLIPADNPLRYPSQPIRESVAPVQTVAYQPESYGDKARSNPNWRTAAVNQDQPGFGNQLPELSAPSTAPQDNPLVLPDLPNTDFDPQSDPPNTLRNQQPAPTQPSLETIPSLESFAEPDPAPQPPQSQNNAPSFPPQAKEERSPRDLEKLDPPKPLNNLSSPQRIPPRNNQDSAKANQTDDSTNNAMGDDELDEILKRAKKSSLPNCVSQRDLLRGKPLSAISLDVSPKLSDGLASLKRDSDTEEAGKSRSEFEKRSMLRDWTDYKGDLLVTGRMIDMRLGNVVIDVGGTERLIPPSQLSDVDMTYIAELWNLPFRCGTGFEPRVGRDFIESTVQWKASGACHNPLYFEQVQLERYGHDAGPIVQPLISSAHFFLTIPMLPYKMGINPPNECQYALGYIRPGNCAPYMIQPFPWSLRGGLLEAGAVVGAAAIIP